ncbi:MAG: hypothetical protein AB7G75_17075 [Candidatus Binatia bacterium]
MRLRLNGSIANVDTYENESRHVGETSRVWAGVRVILLKKETGGSMLSLRRAGGDEATSLLASLFGAIASLHS